MRNVVQLSSCVDDTTPFFLPNWNYSLVFICFCNIWAFGLTLNSYEDRLSGCISNSIISGANVQPFVAFSTDDKRLVYNIVIFCPGNVWFRITIGATSEIHWIALIHCHVFRNVSDVWWI